MASSIKTPYEILGVSETANNQEIRASFRKKIHEHLQNKISPTDFSLICRAQETLTDRDKRRQYASIKAWFPEIPIDQYTSQQLAAEPRLLDYLKKRLEKASFTEINSQDPVTNQTTLYCAARAGNLQAVRFLTECGAESDIWQHSRSTALHAASYFGHPDVVRILLESGANYRIQNLGNRTAEVEAEDDAVKQVFVELQENPYVRVAANEFRWFRENPLTEHVDTEYFAQRQTLLHCAAKKGYINIVRLLVEKHSADIDLLDVNGNSPLHLAVYGGYHDVVEYLLNHGCDPRSRNRWGTTAEEAININSQIIADLFESMRNRDMFEMAKMGFDWWFEYYFDEKLINRIYFADMNLLQYACRYGHHSVAKWLLEHGAKVDVQMTTESKNTPLHDAKYYGHLSILELLLEHGADVNIKNRFEDNIFRQKVSHEVPDHLANKINQLLEPYKSNLKGVKLLDIYVYEDDDDTEKPIAELQLSMNAGYHDLLAALPGASNNQPNYFSVARRELVFKEKDPTILSAVYRARYASSKFIDTPIHLIRHKEKPKTTENQRPTCDELHLYTQQLSRHGKLTPFVLEAPIIEEKTIAVNNLIFTFSENSANNDIKFEVTTFFPSDPKTFVLPGCICLFKTEICSDTSSVAELPVVSLFNEPNARLYTLAAPTSCWFTSNSHEDRLPMMNGIYAWVRHAEIIPNHLTLPLDLFMAANLGQPLTERNDPVPCTCLLIRERNTDKFPLIAYHGTNINVIRSILIDGLAVPGTVVNSGLRINPPMNHIGRKRSYHGMDDYAGAIFLSPSLSYTSELAFAIPFSNGDRQLIPVLECSVKHGSYKTFPGTVHSYVQQPGDDMNALDWRIEDPTNIEINAVLFIHRR